MGNKLIKICGVRDPITAKNIVKAGADFVGIIFHPASKRFVDIQTAKKIAAATIECGAKPVAVFVNHSAVEMDVICKATDIKIIQLHGHVSRSQHYLLSVEYQRIFVLPVGDQSAHKGLEFCKHDRDFLLVDHFDAGSGKSFNWKIFKFKHKYRWFLAGGLTADNVKDAILTLNSDGVDVASGVENENGEIDMSKVEKFIGSIIKSDPASLTTESRSQ